MRSKLIISIWNKEELAEERKELIIVPFYKKGNKSVCSNCRGISLLPATFKNLSNILLPSLTLYSEEIIGDYQCGLRRNRATTDHIFCIRQIYEKKREYNETVHQLFIHLKRLMIQLGGRSCTILSLILGTNFADRRRPLCRYSSLAD